MIELADDGPGERVLYAANAMVMEYFVFAVLADDVRDDLDLPYLKLPVGRSDIAPGYQLGEVANGSGTLFRGDSPVAAAPGDHASFSALVPLSHFLRLPPRRAETVISSPARRTPAAGRRVRAAAAVKAGSVPRPGPD